MLRVLVGSISKMALGGRRGLGFNPVRIKVRKGFDLHLCSLLEFKIKKVGCAKSSELLWHFTMFGCTLYSLF